MRFSTTSAAVLALSLPVAFAQTSTTCNPLDTTCPENKGLDATSFSSNFMQGKSALSQWTTAEGTTLSFGSNGAEFSMSKAGEAPTISTDFYFFFGTVEVKMQAAPGTGIVSSIVLLSDDLDEIDWEFLGGNTTTVETNFFGKGNTTVYDRATYQDVTSPQTETHTYTIDWNADRIEWIIDGTTVRTVTADNSLTLYGKNYPQTPMQLKLGNWCGGCAGEAPGTITWAGGETTWADAPYVMYVESVSITNSNPASAYEYQGKSGTWESIKVIKGSGSTNGSTSTAAAGSGAITATAPVGGAGHNSTATKGVSTSTMLTTASLPGAASASAATSSGTAAASATASSSTSTTGSAASLAMLSGTSLLALLCGFMLL